MPINEDKINPEDMKRSWHAQQEDILKEWSEQAGCYRWMHERAYQVYKKQNMRFSIPVIVISTITGTANFAQSGFPESIKGWAPLIIGTLNLASRCNGREMTETGNTGNDPNQSSNSHQPYSGDCT